MSSNMFPCRVPVCSVLVVRCHDDPACLDALGGAAKHANWLLLRKSVCPLVLTVVCLHRATCMLLACSAFGADSTEAAQQTGSLLLPQTEADYSHFLTALMDSQHKMLQTIHGVDSPQVALSTTLLDLQGSVSWRCPCLLHTSPPVCRAEDFTPDGLTGLGHILRYLHMAGCVCARVQRESCDVSRRSSFVWSILTAAHGSECVSFPCRLLA